VIPHASSSAAAFAKSRPPNTGPMQPGVPFKVLDTPHMREYVPLRVAGE
jgi:hypothetical protein